MTAPALAPDEVLRRCTGLVHGRRRAALEGGLSALLEAQPNLPPPEWQAGAEHLGRVLLAAAQHADALVAWSEDQGMLCSAARIGVGLSLPAPATGPRPCGVALEVQVRAQLNLIGTPAHPSGPLSVGHLDLAALATRPEHLGEVDTAPPQAAALISWNVQALLPLIGHPSAAAWLGTAALEQAKAAALREHQQAQWAALWSAERERRSQHHVVQARLGSVFGALLLAAALLGAVSGQQASGLLMACALLGMLALGRYTLSQLQTDQESRLMSGVPRRLSQALADAPAAPHNRAVLAQAQALRGAALERCSLQRGERGELTLRGTVQPG